MWILWLLAVFTVMVVAPAPTENQFKVAVEAIWDGDKQGTVPNVGATIKKLDNRATITDAHVDDYFKQLDAFNDGKYIQAKGKAVVLWTGPQGMAEAEDQEEHGRLFGYGRIRLGKGKYHTGSYMCAHLRPSDLLLHVPLYRVRGHQHSLIFLGIFDCT